MCPDDPDRSSGRRTPIRTGPVGSRQTTEGVFSMGNRRKAGLLVTKNVTPPWEKGEENPTVFTIKKANMEESIARQNLHSRVRYVQNITALEEYITERDAPQGDIQFATVRICLIGWNLRDDDTGQTLELSEENMLKYLEPRELAFLYAEVMALNPLWLGRLDEGKPQSESDSKDRSSSSSTESPSSE
jgi:hypothetical protein